MAQVTGGKILYNRSVQPAPYETKALGAEWSFSADDGEDPAAISKKMIADMMALVHQGLGIRTAQPATTPVAAAPEAAGPGTSAVSTPSAAVGKRKKTDKELAVDDAKRAAAPSKPAADPDVIEAPVKAEEFVIEVEETKAIPDNELTAAAARTTERLGGSEQGAAVKVKEFMKGFVPKDQKTNFQLKDIAQARRQEFLDGLKALS